MKLTNEELKSIAEDLDCGMKVYVHKDTKEIKSIIDFDKHMFAEEEMWEDDIKEIESNYDQYVTFTQMETREAFQVMEEFIDTITDDKLKMKLELCLNLSKPFRNFKDTIDGEDEYRKDWFTFKNAKYIKFVEEQLSYFNNSKL